MDAAQCLATLKALGAEAAVVADIVMDPAWRRDVTAVQSLRRGGDDERLPRRRSTAGGAGARVPMAEKQGGARVAQGLGRDDTAGPARRRRDDCRT